MGLPITYTYNSLNCNNLLWLYAGEKNKHFPHSWHFEHWRGMKQEVWTIVLGKKKTFGPDLLSMGDLSL